MQEKYQSKPYYYVKIRFECATVTVGPLNVSQASSILVILFRIKKIKCDILLISFFLLLLLVEAINNAAQEPWGIQCLRYEIKDIQLPRRVKDAMQMQVEAERKKRAVVLESEGK